MSTNIDKLRELALGATGGVWRTESYFDTDGVRRTVLIPFSLELPTGMEESDMAYIAAANPDAVLALLDELRRLYELNTELLEAAKYAVEIISDSWGDDQIEAGDCQACNLLRKAIAKAEGQS